MTRRHSPTGPTGPHNKKYMAPSPKAFVPAKDSPALGMAFMLGACMLFAIMNALFRMMAELGVHPLQSAFLRSAMSMLVFMPVVWRDGGIAFLKTPRVGAILARGLYAAGGMITWVWALSLLPMAEAIAINFTAPLFAVMGSALFLHEKVRARRWAAVLVGFAGVLIVVRPGADTLSIGSLLALMAAMFQAGAALTVRSLTGTEPSDRIVAWTTIMLTVLTLPGALMVWVWPTTEIWLVSLALGVVGVFGHSFMTRAFAHAEASLVMPLDYARLPFGAAIGYLMFAEVPGLYTWIGGAVIAGSAIYIARREAKLAKQPLMPHKPH